MSISEKVLDAIQILADNSVRRADYDRTIQAKILSCEDATIGKYRCRYQDAVFYAYSNNTDITYSDNALVYVLVPGNDFNKEKTILGTTKKLGINYITQAEGDQAYDIIGTNGIENSQTFYLDTNYEYEYSIYEAEGEKSIELDTQAIEKYIKESSSIIVGAAIKTSIKAERQLRGHYGIVYNLKFIDNATGKETIRSYTIDEDNMVGNPYRLLYPIRQYQIFDIDGPNFVRVESIKIFCKSFPDSVPLENNTELHPDIEISQLQLNGACRMSESQINGIAISFYTPQGTFFPPGTKGGNKLITAQVRVKGKLVSADQKIPFYWGKENVGVTPSNPYYNKYLGRGWKCINSKQELDSETFEWIPGKNTYVINFGEATAKDNWLKVAIVYDGNVISKKINIQNLTDKMYPVIESNDGTKFYYDVGHPTLTVKIMQKKDGTIKQIEDISQFQYYWAYEDNTGNLVELPQIFGTESPNYKYNKAVNDLNDLTNDIQKNYNAENIRVLNETLKQYDFIQRVQGNQIHDVQIRNITSFGTFKCSVFSGELYIGTAQITLTNTLDGEGLYSLVINNGSAVYQYNENGVAPNNKTLDNPQQIPALTFTVYDNQGKPLDSNMIVNDSKCKVRWKVPLGNDTLLVDNMPQIPNDPNRIKTESYVYYDKAEILSYGIANKYDIKKQNNQIQLTVDYKGLNLTARTNFTFTKQGEPGTNGTEYVVKIVPNTTMDNPPLWPMITKKEGAGYQINYGINSSAPISEINEGVDSQLFKAQLWQDGEKIWEGISNDDEYKNLKVDLIHWEVLKNIYNKNNNINIEDFSAFQIPSQGKIQLSQWEENFQTPEANIIKCSITYGGQGKTYYGTIPIITAWVKQEKNENNEYKEKYRIGLRDFTGFRHVLYTSDGINPQYDNSHPFEFYCEELIKKEGTEIQTWEDVSNVQGSHQITYTFFAIGKCQSYNSKTKEYENIDTNLLTILGEAYREGLTPNQCPARPAARYDGQCVNIAICCEMRQNGEVIGQIKVPIHYLLNKFGLSHINDWDGNSIQINNNGGYILSPQMGAGVKNSSNQFTGVLMGEVIIPNKKESDIGLLGYVDGDRTIFLNSRNGSAIFGKAKKGQIVIDPTSDDALLYSGNFWKENSYNQSGVPSGYTSNNQNGQGLLINLSKPEIRYGNNNFSVSSEGYIHAVKGGDIANWQIKDTILQSKSGGITLDSSGKVYSGTHNSLTNTSSGFYLAANGLSIGDKFKVSDQGRLRIGEGAVTEDKEGKYWDINGYAIIDEKTGEIKERRSYIAYNRKVDQTHFIKAFSDDSKRESVYLGTDGFSLGDKFSVDAQGNLIANSGTIGGWTLTKDRLYAQNGDDKISIKSNGDIEHWNEKDKNLGWQIKHDGSATFKRGTIGGWQLKQRYTDKEGNTYPDRLVGGDITLNSTGSMRGPNWSISSDGTAHFGKIYGNVMSGKTFTANGFVLGGGGVNGGSSISPSTVGMSGGAGLSSPGSFGAGLYNAYKTEFDKLYIKEADIDSAWIRKKLNYKGFEAKWSPVVTDVTLTSLGEGKYTLSRERYYGLICNLRPAGR